MKKLLALLTCALILLSASACAEKQSKNDMPSAGGSALQDNVITDQSAQATTVQTGTTSSLSETDAPLGTSASKICSYPTSCTGEPKTLHRNTTKRASGNAHSGKPNHSSKWATTLPAMTAHSKLSNAKLGRTWSRNENGVAVSVEEVFYGSKKTMPCINASVGNQTVQPKLYIAQITCSPSHVKCTTAQQALGKSQATVNDIAKSCGALIAVNSESFYGGHWSSQPPRYVNDVVIKNGVQIPAAYCSPHDSSKTSIVVYADGTWEKRVNLTKQNAASYMKKGIHFTLANATVGAWSDGYIKNFGNTGYAHSYPCFAQIDASHYLIIVGEFLSRDTIISVAKTYGAKNIIVQNGGNCTYLYLKGIGNVNGNFGTSVRNINKLNTLESEYKYQFGKLSGGQMGGPCPEMDCIYFK